MVKVKIKGPHTYFSTGALENKSFVEMRITEGDREYVTGVGGCHIGKEKVEREGWGIVNEGGGYRGRDGGMLLNMEEREGEGGRAIGEFLNKGVIVLIFIPKSV